MQETSFLRLSPGAVFWHNGRLLQKIAPVQRGFTGRLQPMYHNCMDINSQETFFVYATVQVEIVQFAEVRASSGRLLFRYAAEHGLIEIKPKNEGKPVFVNLSELSAGCG